MGYVVEVEPDSREQELQFLLQSGIVRENTQLHSLLAYLGLHALRAPEQPLKEHRIGVEALRKPSGYDPRTDPTVRVEVAHLRKRLEEFYRGPGAGRAVQMAIPKGSYVPVFVASPARLPAGQHSHLLQWAAVATVAIAALLIWVAGVRRPDPLAPELRAFWRRHFEGGHPTMLVYGTPLFVKMDGKYFRDPDVNQPEDAATDETTRRILGILKPRETRPAYTFTGVGEAEALFHIAQILTKGGAVLTVEPSHAVGWEDLKGKHAVLLGGRKYNRQIGGLPFKPRFEAVSRRIIDHAPKPGEPAEYRTASDSKHGEISEEFALVSVYNGLSHGTRMVILESSSTEGTLAAAEFVTRPDMIRLAMDRGLAPDSGAYQIVVGARLNRGAVVQLSYRTHATL